MSVSSDCLLTARLLISLPSSFARLALYWLLELLFIPRRKEPTWATFCSCYIGGQKTPMSSFFFVGEKGHKIPHPSVICPILEPLTNLLSSHSHSEFFSVLFVCLFFMLFPGFVIVLGREEERDTNINHLV